MATIDAAILALPLSCCKAGRRAPETANNKRAIQSPADQAGIFPTGDEGFNSTSVETISSELIDSEHRKFAPA